MQYIPDLLKAALGSLWVQGQRTHHGESSISVFGNRIVSELQESVFWTIKKVSPIAIQF